MSTADEILDVASDMLIENPSFYYKIDRNAWLHHVQEEVKKRGILLTTGIAPTPEYVREIVRYYRETVRSFAEAHHKKAWEIVLK